MWFIYNRTHRQEVDLHKIRGVHEHVPFGCGNDAILRAITVTVILQWARSKYTTKVWAHFVTSRCRNFFHRCVSHPPTYGFRTLVTCGNVAATLPASDIACGFHVEIVCGARAKIARLRFAKYM